MQQTLTFTQDQILQSHQRASKLYKIDPLPINDSAENISKYVQLLNEKGIINMPQLSQGSVALNDDSIIDPSQMTNNAYVFARLYQDSLIRDAIAEVVPPMNVLSPYMNTIKFFAGQLGGYPDVYHPRNLVPLVNLMMSLVQRPIVKLQIAVEYTLDDIWAARSSSGDNPAVDIQLMKRRAAVNSLYEASRKVALVGLPSLGIYGMFNDPNLPAAVPFKDADWRGDTATYTTVIRAIESLIDRLSQQVTQASNSLSMTLILPFKYQASLNFVNDKGASDKSVRTYLRENYPGLNIIFSPYANEGADGKGIAILFRNTTDNGVPPFFNAVGLNWMNTPASTHQQTLKIFQELYLLQTAGTVLVSPKDVVIAQFDK